MESKVRIAGHPVHPMIVAYPIAFYTATLVSFIVYNSNLNSFWFKIAVVANSAGVIMAVVAALPGFIDWLGIPKFRKAKKIGLNHLLCNVGALLLFGINLYLQPGSHGIQRDVGGNTVFEALERQLLAMFLGSFFANFEPGHWREAEPHRKTPS